MIDGQMLDMFGFVMSLNPTLYYRLGDSTFSAARDEMGVNDGAYVNGPNLAQPGLIAGDNTPSCEFGNSTDTEMQFLTPGNAAGGVTGSASIGAWIHPTDWFGAGRNQVLFWGDQPPQFVIVQDSGSLIFQMWDGSNVRGKISTSPPATNETHFVIGTYDDATGEWAFYVDGVQVGTATDSVSYTIDNLASRVANNPGQSRPFIGRMQDAMFFGHALSADEANAIYWLGWNGPLSG